MDSGGVEEAWGGQRLSCDDVYVMDFVGVVRPYMGRSHLQSPNKSGSSVYALRSSWAGQVLIEGATGLDDDGQRVGHFYKPAC